ncbi:MAG: M81 family metallopeptidase [Ruminococcaceae bacterium]|nr:M81 family metallopeptidase [Oscillospiraceae bacterium]
MKKRVYVAGIQQETNAFNPLVSEKSIFGDYNCEQLKGTRGMVGGLVDALSAAENVCVTYGQSLGAPSYGPVSDAVWQNFLKGVLDDLATKGPFDGIALAMHGATSSPSTPDVCGEILAAVRTAVGESVPIAVSHDLHANVTKKSAKSADYICGYHEYPHIDIYETGLRAAKLLLKHLAGEPQKTAYAAIPMIAPAHAYTTKEGSLPALVNDAKSMVERGEISDFSLFEAQPWLDVPEFASAVLVTAKDEETATRVANDLAKRHFALRKELQGAPLLTVEEVIKKGLANKTGKPVVLVDSSDSRGAGANTDSAAVLEVLLPYRDEIRAAVGVSDVPAVEKAFSLGVGAVADFTLGATIAPSLSSPVLVKNARVRSLHLGDFTAVGPIGRGARSNCGRVAVLEVGKILVQVSEICDNAKDIGFYRSFGIDPEFCQLVSVKACTSLRAGYTPIAAEICNTDTPGAAGAVLQKLHYQQRPVPLYPFEEINEGDIQAAVCYR